MELLIGSLFARALTGDRSQHPWPERAVDTLLHGLRPPDPAPPDPAPDGIPLAPQADSVTSES
jgi:hypothetical protein